MIQFASQHIDPIKLNARIVLHSPHPAPPTTASVTEPNGITQNLPQ